MSDDFMHNINGREKKMRELMDKYGDTREAIENKCTNKEWYEYLFAGSDEMLAKMKREPIRNNAPDKAAIEKRHEILLQKAKEHLRSSRAEGNTTNIYLDIYGNITIGAGKMVNDKKTFMALDLRKGNRAATYAEKEAAYNTFDKLSQSGEFGHDLGAEHYEIYSPLRITSQTSEELLDKHVRNDIARLSKGMPEFDSLPLPLQEVLVDIRYNSGAITEDRWPNLRKAIRAKDLSAIIKEINRKGISLKRNAWVREKIRSITDWGE